MRRPFAVLLPLAAIAAAANADATRARGGVGRAGAPTDTVRGVVFDSLLHLPLAGATVLAEPGGLSATTDEQGRFTIGGPARVRRLTVFHGLLDRTGIGSLSAALDSAPTPVRAAGPLVIATPSIATIWSRLCPGAVAAGGRHGIVFGVARTANGSTRVAGARVRTSWESDALSQAGQAARVVDSRTDSIGAYYACGVPPLENVQIIGYSSEFSSGSVSLAGDSVPLRKLDLVLGAAGQTAEVRGAVVDQRRAPVVGATIDVDGLDASAKSDQAGRFLIPNAPTGSRMLLVRAVGYTPVLLPVEVLETGAEEVRVELERMILLPGVRVRETNRLPMIRAGFEERRRVGMGTFLDSADFQNRFDTRSIFQGAAGVTVDARSVMYEWQLYLPSSAGMCRANIIFDGMRSDTKVLQATPKEHIAAVEIYLRAAVAPPEYLPVGAGCGLIMVWTKSAFRR